MRFVICFGKSDGGASHSERWFGHTTNVVLMEGYDGIMVIAEAIRAQNPTDPEPGQSYSDGAVLWPEAKKTVKESLLKP